MWRLEVKLQGFLQVGKSLFFALTLAGYVDFEALRDIPIPFAPDGCGERPLHETILAHVGETQFDARQSPKDCGSPPWTYLELLQLETGFTRTDAALCTQEHSGGNGSFI